MNIKQKHPEKNAVCIDYGLAIVMLPTVLTGSLLGVLLNVMFPPLILQIVLTLLLTFLSIQSGCKAKQIFNQETKKLRDKKEEEA